MSARPRPSPPMRKAAALLALLGSLSFLARAGTAEPAGPAAVRVRDLPGLRRALAEAKPGSRILVEPGEYPGGVSAGPLAGAPGKPVVLAAADPKRPPVFTGPTSQLHLSDVTYLEVRDLTFRGSASNGINVDDGGTPDTPTHHVVLSRLRVEDVGPTGNRDGIKLSGVDDFRVEDCVVERWGTGGSAVDMVGCHRGVLEGNVFRHTEEQNASGVQMKGGTSHVVVRKNRFEHAGGRAVNMGGSTGLEFFRPPLASDPRGEHAEARDLVVEGNVFVGSAAPVAFVGATDVVVRFNTIYRPGRWALRILQETRVAGFVPCRRGEFTDNLVVFVTSGWGGAANVGPGTDPASFTFARNVWYAQDRPGASRPDLPTPETKGVYGKDPLLVDPEQGDFSVRSGSPAAKAGAHALPR